MNLVKIVVDSASDIPITLLNQLNISVVPLIVTFGETSYVDIVDLSVEAFWDKAANSQRLPKTAAPPIESFVKVFEDAIKQGYEEILCISLSSKLSATFQHATKAAESLSHLPIAINVFDSRLAAYGEGSIAVFAAQHAHLPLAELLIAVKERTAHTRVIATLETLDNLRKGGRIGAAAATLGSLLSIKPIIEIINGEVQAHSKQRTRRRALEFIYDLVASQSSEIETISVISANATDVNEFVQRIATITKIDDILISTIGPVIGTHGGAGIIGVCFSTKSN